MKGEVSVSVESPGGKQRHVGKAHLTLKDGAGNELHFDVYDWSVEPGPVQETRTPGPEPMEIAIEMTYEYVAGEYNG